MNALDLLLQDSIYLIDNCKTLEELQRIKNQIFGRKSGYLTIILKTVGALLKNETLQ